MITLNEYVAAFPRTKESGNIGEMDLDGILLNSMTNVWSNQAYVQGFDCETITSKKLFICFNAWKLWKQFMKVF